MNHLRKSPRSERGHQYGRPKSHVTDRSQVQLLRLLGNCRKTLREAAYGLASHDRNNQADNADKHNRTLYEIRFQRCTVAAENDDNQRSDGNNNHADPFIDT